VPGAVASRSRAGPLARPAAVLGAGAARLDRALDAPLRRASRPVLRLREIAVTLLLTAVAFGQSGGLVSGDTKLDLTQDPAGWLAGGLRVWSPDALGSLQNQAYGYLFPIGPFHWLGLAAGLPAWVVQRLWWSALLVAAFLGAVRLAERLDVGTSGSRLLAGCAYALSPRVLTELGGLSSELMPLAALPWVVLPLVGAPERPRLAAARSGVALLCAGAVNAAATLAVLPLAAIWLVPGLRTPAGRRLAGWWAVAVGLATAWWVVSLLVQGAYAAPFLDFIETAATTTSTTSPVEVLRGTTHWLAYLAPSGLPWWRAGWTLVTVPAVVLNTAVVAALGLAGLCSRRMPGRGRLGAAALLGLLVMTLGHDGAVPGPLAESFRAVLDGPLAAFRNVHKADPLLRLPLVLGLAHALTLLPDVRPRRLLAVVAGIAVLGTATPAVAGQLAPAGAFADLPRHWVEAAAWVDQEAGTSSTLLVPAAGDAEHLWGRPLEDPLQVLADAPVVVRDAVPLGGPEITRLLDAVGARLDSGQGSPGLAQVLGRAGVRHVVVRNDLDPDRTGAPRPLLVAQALERSPGLRRVRSFGPPVGDDRVRDGLVGDRGLSVRRPAVEVFEVVGAPEEPVAVYQMSGAWRLDGGPEALLQLADRGLLGTADGVVRVGDGDAGASPRAALTDGLRRRSVDVGRVRENASVTLTAAEEDRGRLPGLDDARQTVARWTGVRSVTASSSAADVDALLLRRADAAPFSGVDGDRRTSWMSADLSGAVGQWLQVDLQRPADLEGATITLNDDDAPDLARVTEVEVRTDAGAARTRLDQGAAGQGAAGQELSVPPGRTARVRVTVTAVHEDDRLLPAAFAELVLPGVTAGRTVVPPALTDRAPDDVVLLDKPVGGRDACVPARTATRCSPALLRRGEEPGVLDRTVRLSPGGPLPLTGAARPEPGPELEALLDTGAAVRVRTSSRAVADPRGRPATLVDGDLGTGWVAGADDERPWVELTWPAARVVDRVDLRTGLVVGARPTRVVVETDGGRIERVVPRDGRVALPPSPTSRLRVQVVAAEDVVDVALDGRLSALPVGLAEVSVPALGDLLPPSADATAPVAVPCGAGPVVAVDGAQVPLRLLGTRADLEQLRPVLAQPCTADGTVQLADGETRLQARPGGGFTPTSLTLGPVLPQPTATPRTADVLRWEAEERVVRVGPGERSWLAVRENRNAGWTATLDGERLEPARLDGWQQAFVLPEGAGGEVRLEYRPGQVHRTGLAVGAAAALLLAGLAVGRRRPRPEPVQPPARSRLGGLVPPALLTALAGPVGLAVWASVALLARRSRNALPLLAGGAALAAGAVVAWAPWAGPRAAGAFGLAAAVPALVAVAALAVAVTTPTRVSAAPSAPSGAEPAPRPPEG
jgi:arabinofuranan 3-O-arabinosyltransferase